MSKANSIQSIKRALDALDYLLAGGLHDGGVTLRAVADHLGVAAPTAHNILATLISCGYAGRDRKNCYRPGRKCRDLARGAQWAAGLTAHAAGVVYGLAERAGESVVLAILLHGRRYPILRAEGRSVIRVDSMFEEASPFFQMVTGRVLAACCAPDELQAILEIHGLPGPHWACIDTRDALDRALEDIRRQGAAEELLSDLDLYALAVPVLDREGVLLAALGIPLPAFRATPEHLTRLRAELTAAAQRIGHAIPA
jgi:DNA-binding IclR family transcriptional regulator